MNTQNLTCVHCRKALTNVTKAQTFRYPKSRRIAHRKCVGTMSQLDVARMDDLIIAQAAAKPAPAPMRRVG